MYIISLTNIATDFYRIWDHTKISKHLPYRVVIANVNRKEKLIRKCKEPNKLPQSQRGNLPMFLRNIPNLLLTRHYWMGLLPVISVYKNGLIMWKHKLGFEIARGCLSQWNCTEIWQMMYKQTATLLNRFEHYPWRKVVCTGIIE